MGIIAVNGGVHQGTSALQSQFIRRSRKGGNHRLQSVYGSSLCLEGLQISLSDLTGRIVKSRQRQFIFAGKVVVNASFF